MLVRHVLSQLSYAPEVVVVGFASTTGFIIHAKRHFVKHFFQIFSKNFFSPNVRIPFKKEAESLYFNKQISDILRREAVYRVTELALHRKVLPLSGNVGELLSAQAD